MKILLTGSTGTVGGNILRSGILSDAEVYCTVRSNAGRAACPANLFFVDCDLVRDDIQKALPEKMDAIIHAAAMAPKSAKHPEDYLENIKLAEQLNDYAIHAGVGYLAYLSSGSVYGQSGKNCKETDKPEPSDDYGRSMVQAEKIFMERKNALNLSIIRLFYPYGFDEFTRIGNFISKLYLKIVARENIIIGTASEKHKFRPILMDDVNKIVKWTLKNKWAGVVNVAGPEEVSLKEMLLKMGKIAGIHPQVVMQDNIPVPFNADISKLESLAFDFRFTPIEEGIRLAIQRINNSFVS